MKEKGERRREKRGDLITNSVIGLLQCQVWWQKVAVIIASSGLTTTTSSSSRLRRQTDVQQRHDSRFPRYFIHHTRLRFPVRQYGLNAKRENRQHPGSQHRILFHSAASRRRLRPRPRPSPSLVRQINNASTTTLFDDLTICNERYHIALVQTCERDTTTTITL